MGNSRSGLGERNAEKAEMGVRTLLKKVAAPGRSSLRPELENLGSGSDHKNALLRGNKLESFKKTRQNHEEVEQPIKLASVKVDLNIIENSFPT